MIIIIIIFDSGWGRLFEFIEIEKHRIESRWKLSLNRYSCCREIVSFFSSILGVRLVSLRIQGNQKVSGVSLFFLLFLLFVRSFVLFCSTCVRVCIRQNLNICIYRLFFYIVYIPTADAIIVHTQTVTCSHSWFL